MRPLKIGIEVLVTSGKHAGKIGIVEHSDKSITTVRFAFGSDPVWTNMLVVQSNQHIDQLADDRDQWKHEAAQQMRLK